MVRLLRRSDVAEVVAGWNRCLRYDRISAEKFERTIFEDPNYEGAGNLVAVKNQQIIGFIAAVAREGTVGRDGIGTAEEQEFGYIKGMFVLSEHQEEQTKHSLLTRALEYLQSKGKRTAKIGQYTGSYFSPGIDGRYRKELTFFRKNDFKEVDAEEDVMVDLKSFTPTDYQKQAQARVAELGIIITRYRPEFLSWMRRFVRRIDYPQWFPQGWELRFRKNNSHRCVALRKSEIVGWARFFKDPAGWWFGPIAVLDQFRRMGIGTCLLLESMLQMMVLGAPSVTAGWANVPFYVRNGWRVSRRYAVLRLTGTS